MRTLDPTTNPGVFETLNASLEEAVAERRSIEAKLAALAAPQAEPRLPTEQEIVDAVLDIERRMQFDPTTAREQLRRMLVDGRITVTPKPDGSWEAVSALLVGPLAGTRKPRSGGPGGASGDKVENGSCAGRI